MADSCFIPDVSLHVTLGTDLRKGVEAALKYLEATQTPYVWVVFWNKRLRVTPESTCETVFNQLK